MQITGNELKELLRSINDRYRFDFSEYAEASMKRRVSRFATLNKISSCRELKSLLENDEALFTSFISEITVNVTEMFRDPSFFKSLSQKVFPALNNIPHRKIWHAGCSSGEEAYSVAVMLSENNLYNGTRIYATDINPDVIHHAKEGIYPVDVMKEYTSNYMESGGSSSFSDYYTAKYDSAIINKTLKKNMVFSVHNLVCDHSFNEFNLIVCRNVLIYFNKNLQEKVFRLFHESLPLFGFLALGPKESMLSNKLRNKYEVIDKEENIFRKIA
jgi:chemotaxis protein methyltransferase CheR